MNLECNFSRLLQTMLINNYFSCCFTYITQKVTPGMYYKYSQNGHLNINFHNIKVCTFSHFSVNMRLLKGKMSITYIFFHVKFLKFEEIIPFLSKF